MPENHTSTIKKVRISAGGQGSVTVNALQMANDGVIRSFADGIQKSDSSNGSTIVYKKGDVNGDDNVNTADVRIILRYVIGGGTFSAAQQKAADYNSDSKIDTQDVRTMLTSISTI